MALLSAGHPTIGAVFTNAVKFLHVDLTTASTTETNLLVEAAESITNAGADLVLVSGVLNWQAANELERLTASKNFKVLLCTSFATGNQMAVLSKHAGYFSWTDTWAQGKGAGYAFAAVRMGNCRLGCFFVRGQAETRKDSDGANANQLLLQMQAVKNWVANRPDAFVLVGEFNGARQATEWGRALTHAGLSESETSIPGLSPFRIFAEPGVESFLHPVMTHSSGLRLGRFELQPARGQKIASSHYAGTSPGMGEKTASLIPQLQASGNDSRWRQAELYLIAGAVTLLLSCISFTLKRRRRKTRRLLLPVVDPSPYLVVAPSSVSATRDESGQSESPVVQLGRAPLTHTQGLKSNEPEDMGLPASEKVIPAPMLGWLREMFISRIMKDRGELLRAQQEATHRALAVDERIARVEQQLKEQNYAYQAQIEALTRELQATREENRELLRERIAQVKIEMETARARLMASLEGN